jgi:hypothetical protein
MEMDKIFADKILTELFTNFAVSEFSPENVYCFLDILEFPKLDETEKLELLESMKLKYFNGFSSEYEVNVTGVALKDFNEKYEKRLWDEIFTKISPIIRTNMSDTYSSIFIDLIVKDSLYPLNTKIILSPKLIKKKSLKWTILRLLRVDHFGVSGKN